MSVAVNQTIEARNPGRLESYPVLAAKTLYQGTAAFLNRTSGAGEGYATDDDDSGANTFAGIVREQQDNASGDSGDLTVECYTEGSFVVPVSGASQAMVGDLAYATDNYTFTNDSTNATKVGRFTEYVRSGYMRVSIDVQQA